MLNNEFFNSLRFNKVRRKYYDATAVDTVLLDIRIRAEEMNKELSGLRRTLSEKDVEIEILKARLLQAEAKADDALKANSAAKNKNEADQNTALSMVGDFYSKVRTGYERQLEDLNEMWQSFLCNYGSQDEPVPDDLESKIGRIASEIREIDEKT